MRIAHIGDIHLGLNYPGPTPDSRFEDITRTMDWCANRIIDEKCDLVLVAGDMFKDARVFLDRASREIKAAANWIRNITQHGIEVLVISGTPSHDAISAYDLLREMHIDKCTVFTSPGWVKFPDGTSVCCIPGMNRAAWAAIDEYKHLPPQEIHQLMTDNITEICHTIPGGMKPDILLAHLSYDLADKGFEDVLMQHEPVLTSEAVADFNLVCLGHIHRPQQNGQVFYCGSPERLSFNDEDITPGFWIHDGSRHDFYETPARKYETLKWNEEMMRWVLEKGYILPYDFKGAIVRLRYDCTETMVKQISRKALEKALYDAGAFYVTEIVGTVTESIRDRDQEVTAEMGVIDALQKWCEQPDVNIPEGEIPALLAMAGEMLQEVKA